MANLLPTQSFLTVQGPVKVEYLEFTGTITISGGTTTQAGVDDGDTFDSKMVAPKFLTVTSKDDASDTAWDYAINSSTGRITLTNTGAAAVEITVTVVGH
jgi:hypothetical protein